MSENRVGLGGNASPERARYRLLLEVTDMVARAKSPPDAFKELAPPVLDLTGGELLNLALYDPRRNCMLNQYWKKNQESGEFDTSPVDEAATGWAWKHQAPLAIPDTEREQRFPGCMPALLNHGVRSSSHYRRRRSRRETLRSSQQAICGTRTYPWRKPCTKSGFGRFAACP